MPATVSQLWIYPVKSLKGIRLEASRVTARGLAHDRRFVVTDPDGHFFTQREIPAMATVWTEIEGGELRLSAPDFGEVTVPLEPAGGASLQAEVWDSVSPAVAPSPEADRWLSEVLARPCRLAYMPESTRRESNVRHAGPGRLVGFADGYAHLVVSEASLASLNARLERPVPFDRFRPNIVLAGAAAFEEDGWKDFSAGTARFRMAKPCGRCQVTTTDQSTGEVTGPEPLETLGRWRPSEEFGARFGMNAVTLAEGDLRVGNEVLPTG